MTSALSVSTRKTQSLWNAVHQDISSNSVIVKNLSPATSEDAIMIHFQRKRNGGGEVERVRLLSEGVAVVTFEKPEVADSVLGRRHVIEGALVTLERHNIPCPDQVFGKVSGRLDPHALGVSFSDMEVILRTIHDETKVNWKEIFDGFVVSGTFEQLKIVRESLSCHLKKAKEYRSKRTLQDSREPLGRDITATREFMVDSKVSTESTSLRTSAAICLKSIDKGAERKCNNPLIPNENQAQGNKGHGSPHDLVEKERVTATVNDSPKKLDQLDVTGDVSNTRKKSKAQIPDETESQSDSTSRPTPVTPSAFLENSKEKTIGVEHLKTEVVDSALQLSRISKIGNTSTNVKRPQDQGEDQGHGDVENLLISVKKQEMPLESSEGKTDRPTKPKRKRPAGSLNKDVTCEDVQSQSTLFNRSCDAENTTLSVPILNEASDQGNQSCSHLETPKFEESLSKGKDEYTIERNSLKYITSTGITVWLQKGDITSSDVGVLLCPANPTLSYKEGLSKLILEKGGHILKDEFHSIAQAKCPLPYGNAFLTTNGNLPCRSVLHTVLPPWIEDKENEKAYKRQIHRSLIDALKLASGHRHRSVAIPPLGQDGNCIPLKVSAEVITRVIAKFSNSVGPMHIGIDDIHIVCEDDNTFAVFAKELSSFSFSGEKTYFTMATSENVLQGEEKIAKYQRSGRVENLKTEVVDSAFQLPRISEIGNASTNVKRPQDQGEDQGHGDVENLLISVKRQEMPLESSEGKTDRPKRPAGSLDKDVTCEDVQSQSTLFNRSCDAENTTLSIPTLNEASDQGNQPCSHLETPKFDESLSKGKDEYTIERNSLKYITSTGITVWLQKGDITSSDVGVLLIPANPTLSYKKGLCKLILEKGGHILKEELHRIAQAKCPLPYGNVFLTSNGNLPCRGVLHTVLPPWMEENENKKAYKRQIHRSLIDALTLASGYRHRSVAISPLGQDGNCIPLEVSAEVITRVIAKFSESVGPMHTGINDIHIVCEDDDTVDVFAKELSFFSFSGDKTYFTMTPSENVLQGEDKIAKYQGSGRTHAKCEEGVVPTIADQLSVQHIQKSTSSSKTGSVPKNENTEIHANFPKNEIVSSSQLKPHKPGSPTILPFVNGKKESVSSNSPRQCCENTITIISSTSTKIVDIAKENVFEILKVSETATIALVEGVPKRVATQDDSSKRSVKELNLKVDDENFKEGNGNVAETREVLQNISAPKMSKALTPEIQQPKPSYFSTEKEPSKSIPGIESRHIQRGLKDTPSLHPFHRHAHEATEVHSLRMDNSLLVTSPTVEALLNADLRLGIQGLHIEHERNRKIDNGEDEGNKSFLSFQPKERNSNEHLVSCITTSNEKQMITEKYFQEDINENHQSKMISEAAEKGHKRNSPYDKKCDSKETDEKKDESEPTLVDNVHNGNDGKVSAELPVAFMCALCQDTVDHPELIHPNFCVQHKFCDDCILKVFTFSSNCPVCVDSYGLTAFEEAYNAAHNHTDEYDTKDLHPSVSNGSSPLDQEGGLLWTAYPDVFKASQPPGQMMWKKYENSLPGFEGCGTIVVTFAFYDGIQSSEHPSPGAKYKGMSCIAYLPYTEEGEQVLKLLWKAFDARLVFTVSNSASDPPGQVALNGVELKTSATSDARNGYPDHGYLSRVRKQLAAKGFQ